MEILTKIKITHLSEIESLLIFEKELSDWLININFLTLKGDIMKKDDAMLSREENNLPSYDAQSFQSRLFYKAGVAPGTVAFFEKIITHPLDTVITFQQQNNTKFFSTSRTIYKNYGASGFYRGLSWPLVMSTPPGAIIVYGSYEALKEVFYAQGLKNKTMNAVNSSLITAIFCSIIATPIEAKRIRDTFKIKVENPTSKLGYHFKGFIPMTLKLTLHSPFVLAGTDIFKERAYQYGLDSNNTYLKEWTDIKKPYTAFIGGLFTGIFSQLITTPADVLKTKVMGDYSAKPLSLKQHLIKAYSEKNLFQSTGSRVLKFGLHSSVMLGGMHMIGTFFQQRRNHPELIPDAESTHTLKN